VGALVAHVAGAGGLAVVLVAAVAVAATLESVLAVCLGCHIFTLLMRAGVVPESVCAECADINLRQRTST